jgi:hypothetical protein
MVAQIIRVRAGTEWPAPLGVGLIRPPVVRVIEGHRARRALEHHRPGDQELLSHPRVAGRIERPLGNGLVTRLGDEGGVLRVGDRMAIDPEAVDANAVNGRLLRIEVFRAHDELTPRNPLHVLALRHRPAEYAPRRLRPQCKWHFCLARETEALDSGVLSL